MASEKVKKELDELFDARKEIQQLDTPTESEKMGSQMIMSDIDDKAKAIKTFVDWLNRNIDEMIKISDSGDYENVMNSKAHKIFKYIAKDETGNMLVALAPQLDKF